jgi:hypothetical protein
MAMYTFTPSFSTIISSLEKIMGKNGSSLLDCGALVAERSLVHLLEQSSLASITMISVTRRRHSLSSNILENPKSLLGNESAVLALLVPLNCSLLDVSWQNLLRVMVVMLLLRSAYSRCT